MQKNSVNKAVLVGYLGASPEGRYTPAGRATVSFSLATNEFWVQPDGEQKTHTEWHNIIAWGKNGEFVEQYIKKGQLLCIEGRLKTQKWLAKEGHPLSKTEIIANNVVPLDWKK